MPQNNTRYPGNDPIPRPNSGESSGHVNSSSSDINWNDPVHYYDPANLFFEHWLFPEVAAHNEYERQVTLQKAQNEWNSEEAKMERMKAAGINPNLAAAGIAGAGASPSVGSAPSSVGQGAQGVAAAGQAIGNVGSAIEALSHANERSALLQSNKNVLIADAYLKWKEAGWNDIQSKSMAVALQYLSTEKVLGIMNLAAQTQKLRGEYDSFMQGIKESQERIKQIDIEIKLADAQRDLTTKLSLETEKRTLGIDIENQQKQWRLDKMKELNIDPNNPIEYNMFIGSLEGNEDVVLKGANIIYESNYQSSKGQFSAEAEKAYDIALNSTKGKEESEKQYRENRQWYIEHEHQVKAYWDFMYKCPKNIREWILKGTMKEFKIDGDWFNGNGGAPPMPTQLKR